MRSGTEQNPNPRSARSHGRFLRALERPARPTESHRSGKSLARRGRQLVRRERARRLCGRTEPPVARAKTKPSVRRKRRALRPVDLWTAQMALLRQAAAHGYAEFGAPNQSQSSRQLAMWRALQRGATLVSDTPREVGRG
jgi:hypothetical protein